MVEPTGPHVIKPDPDPTTRTIDLLEQSVAEIHRELVVRAEIRQREHAALQELIEFRISANRTLTEEQLRAARREAEMREAHRLELKSDSEKTLNTATIAAEKAVQAALAAAEKARDQQTIASQLATTKAEEASKERQDQQGETFTTGISALQTGFNDVKLQLSELRAERRGTQEQVIVARDNAADLKPMVDAIAALTQAQAKSVGAKNQVSDQRDRSTLVVAVAGTFLLALSIGLAVAALLLGK